MTDAEQTLGDILLAYYRERMAAITGARRRLGLGEMDTRALLYVAAHPGTRPTTLREHLGVTSAAVTTLIDRLVARGAFRRDPDPDDRRANRVTILIDLDEQPWADLVAFDGRIDAAVAALPTGRARAAAEAVSALLRTAGGRSFPTPSTAAETGDRPQRLSAR